MNDELIRPFLNKNVKITFKDNESQKGLLKIGYVKLGNEWKGTGYHLEMLNYDFGFKKSHIKKIEVLE